MACHTFFRIPDTIRSKASLPPGSLWIWDSILVSAPRLHAIFPGPELEHMHHAHKHKHTDRKHRECPRPLLLHTGRTLCYFNCTFTMTYKLLIIARFMEEFPLCCPATWNDPQTAPELLLRCGLLCLESRQHFVQYIIGTVAFSCWSKSEEVEFFTSGPKQADPTWGRILNLGPDGSLLLRPLILFQRQLLLGSLGSLFGWCSLVLACLEPDHNLRHPASERLFWWLQTMQ